MAGAQHPAFRSWCSCCCAAPAAARLRWPTLWTQLGPACRIRAAGLCAPERAAVMRAVSLPIAVVLCMPKPAAAQRTLSPQVVAVRCTPERAAALCALSLQVTVEPWIPMRAVVLRPLSCVALSCPIVGIPGRPGVGLGGDEGVEARVGCSIGGSATAASH
eukprot:scaffold35330_cov24-Tisochrysis_lutea.AAC.4